MSFKQFVKQIPVMNQSLAQILGPRLAPFAAFGDSVCRPEVLYHAGMVDRNILSPMLKIRHRVAASAHDVTNQNIGPLYRRHRVVHEIALYRLPLFDEDLLIFSR